jgi:hypothetical protein
MNFTYKNFNINNKLYAASKWTNNYFCLCSKTNLMHYLFSVHFFNQPLHVSGKFVAHHQEVYCLHVYIYIYIYKLIHVLLFS